MDSVAVTVPLRPPTKKMKKRKELDALAPPHAVSRRSSGKRSSQELLSESSDERAEYWNVSTSGGRLVGRKALGRSRAEAGSRAACRAFARACSIFLGAVLLLVTFVLIWLFIDVRQQLTALRAELDQVIAGSEGVPDALQTCHTLDRNFKANITHINDEIRKLNTSLNTFSAQISNLQQELQQVQVSLKSAPELTSVPNTVKELQNNIGQLELEFNDLQSSFKALKDTTQHSQEEQKSILNKVESTLTSLANATEQPQKVPTNETIIETKKLWDAIAELNKNLTHINQTLAMNVSWAKEDIAKDHKQVVSLLDMATNASALIQTLQQECVKRKDQDVLQRLLESLSNRVEKLSSSKNNQERPPNLEQMYNISQSASDTFMSSSAGFQNNGANEAPLQNKPKNLEITTQATYKTSASPSASSSTTAN